MLRAIVFDAYGTLLDVHGAMARHADRLPPDWERISTEWRLKQLEYSWVRTLTGTAHHRDFARVTRDALDYVATLHRLTDTALLDDLMRAYNELPAYKDATPMLRAVRRAGLGTAILSNGSPAMLAEAVAAAGLESLLDHVLSIEDVGVFKPHPLVYGLATAAFGASPGEMGFVSSNPWDAQAAAAFGFQVFWCNRSGLPAEYGLGQSATIMQDLSDLPNLLS